MAYVTPITFVALSTLTAAQLNSIQTNITALWPYTTAGDLPYASAAGVLARLAKGTAGQVLKMNTEASAPEWGATAAAKVSLSASQAISHNTNTAIIFDTEEQDTDGMYSSGNPTRITVQRNGDYLIGCYVIFYTNSTGVRSTAIVVSRAGNSIYDSRNAVGADHTKVSIVGKVSLQTGDTIYTNVYQGSGGNLNVTFASMWAALIP